MIYLQKLQRKDKQNLHYYYYHWLGVSLNLVYKPYC